MSHNHEWDLLSMFNWFCWTRPAYIRQPFFFFPKHFDVTESVIWSYGVFSPKLWTYSWFPWDATSCFSPKEKSCYWCYWFIQVKYPFSDICNLKHRVCTRKNTQYSKAQAMIISLYAFSVEIVVDDDDSSCLYCLKKRSYKFNEKYRVSSDLG